MMKLSWLNKLRVILVLSILGYVAVNIGVCGKVTFWNIVNPYKLGGIFLQMLLGGPLCQYEPLMTQKEPNLEDG